MSETYMIQRLNAQCRCFRDARRGWAGAVVTKREACHDNAKLERCRSPLRVSYLAFFFCSFCKRVSKPSAKIHLLPQPSDNAHYASTPRSARLKRATPTGSNRCPVHCPCPPPRPARARIHSSRALTTTTAISLTILLAISIHNSPRHWTVASASTVDFCSEHLRAALGRDHLLKWHTQAKDTIIRMVEEDTVEGISNSE
jgi:hypothetical protein